MSSQSKTFRQFTVYGDGYLLSLILDFALPETEGLTLEEVDRYVPHPHSTAFHYIPFLILITIARIFYRRQLAIGDVSGFTAESQSDKSKNENDSSDENIELAK